MDHVVYTDFKSHEMEKILDYQKTMIIRGATGRKMPYGRVNVGDVLFLLNNDAEGLIKAKCVVKQVINSEKMDKIQSVKLVDSYANELNLTDLQYKKWAGKRYLVLISIDEVQEIEPFTINKSSYGNMDDWLFVRDINTVI